jgi:hypothetical protein
MDHKFTPDVPIEEPAPLVDEALAATDRKSDERRGKPHLELDVLPWGISANGSGLSRSPLLWPLAFLPSCTEPRDERYRQSLARPCG